MRADAITAHADTRALGRIERRVHLSGRLPLAGGGHARPALCLTTRGLWVVAAEDALRGVVVDLLDDPDLRIDIRRMRSTLRTSEHRLRIPPHRQTELLEAVAIARLRAGDGDSGRDVVVGRHIEAPTEVERTWLGAHLEPEELLLAWLRSRTTRPLTSPILGDTRAELSLVVTDRQVMLVGISEVGDALVEELNPQQAEFASGRRRVTLTAGETQITSLRRNADHYREIGRAIAAQADDRLLEVARLNWLDRRAVGLSLCRALLDAAIRHGHGPARLAAHLIAGALDDPESSRPDLTPALEWLATTNAPPHAVTELWQRWEHTESAALGLVAVLRAAGSLAEPWALNLHQVAHSRANERRRDNGAAADADLMLGEHLISVGHTTRAIDVLEARLAKLPDPASCELRPPSDADSNAEDEDRRLRTRALELLSEARATEEGPDASALCELARLHPLHLGRVEQLEERAHEPLRSRAAEVRSLLSPGALAPSDRGGVDALRGLGDTLLNEVLRHPLTRADSPLVGKLQTLLALVPVPDYSVLGDYCERLSPERHAAAGTALGQAAQLLGVNDVQAFVSRGTKGVGLRAYEGSPPFILIGGQHLDPDTPYFMTPPELRFALGAEFAHLRFGHHRVTASEVWTGAVSKGKEGLGLALGMLPILRGWWIADRVASVTSRVPMGPVRKIMDAAEELNERVGVASPEPASTANRDVISALNEDFIVAHRVMQLTADRAGLVLAGDLHAAVRAMLLVRRDYQDEVQIVQQRGMAQVLGQRAEDGHLAYLDLAIRVAALISFYLSDDYPRLTAASDSLPPPGE